MGQDTDIRPSAALSRRRQRRRIERIGGWASALAAHGLVLAAMAATWPHTPAMFDPQPLSVSLVSLPPQQPPVRPPVRTPRKVAPASLAKAEPARATPTHVKTTPARLALRPTPVVAHVPTLPAAARSTPHPGAGVSEADLAGAETADSGEGAGRPCNMTRRVQDALRKDSIVQSAVSSLSGHAVRVWDGDWDWIDGEDGKGLTAVRQAMMWEIAFAPPACRSQAMRGLVVIAPGQSGARLVVGDAVWRWSDLLTPHPGVRRD